MWKEWKPSPPDEISSSREGGIPLERRKREEEKTTEEAKARDEDGNAIWAGGSRIISGHEAGAFAFFRKGDHSGLGHSVENGQGYRESRKGKAKTCDEIERTIRTKVEWSRLLYRQEIFDAETFTIMRGIHFLAFGQQSGQYCTTFTDSRAAMARI